MKRTEIPLFQLAMINFEASRNVKINIIIESQFTILVGLYVIHVYVNLIHRSFKYMHITVRKGWFR